MVVKVARPYSCYTLFFILERELLLQKRQGGKHANATSDKPFIWGYEGLHTPPVPARYQHLSLPANWYIPGKRKTETRKHSKIHGATSFTELPMVISRNWKCIDPVTRQFCNDVAGILKKRYSEIPGIYKHESPSKKQTVAKKPTALLSAKVRRTETTHIEKAALQQPAKVRRTATTHGEKEALQQALKIAQIAQGIFPSSPAFVTQAPQQGSSNGSLGLHPNINDKHLPTISPKQRKIMSQQEQIKLLLESKMQLELITFS